MRRRRWMLAVGAAVGLAVLLVWTLRQAGEALVVADPLQSAAALVVLGGQVPYRAMEAADLWKLGWAPEVWLTKGTASDADVALAQLGLERPPEYVLSRRVLERVGVPDAAIRVLDHWDDNTIDELQTVVRELRARSADRVILVTSKFHTRRVRTLWLMFIGGRPEAVVRAASGDPFDPAGWWRTSSGALIVVREWLGLVNARIGFPVKSIRALAPEAAR